jgi:hypothetical protein
MLRQKLMNKAQCLLKSTASSFPKTPQSKVIRRPLTIEALRYHGRGSSSGIDVLVAGCGTGRHLIEVACKYKDAQSPPREVIVRSLVACACKESSPKDVAVLLGPIGPQPSQPGFLL